MDTAGKQELAQRREGISRKQCKDETANDSSKYVAAPRVRFNADFIIALCTIVHPKSNGRRSNSNRNPLESKRCCVFTFSESSIECMALNLIYPLFKAFCPLCAQMSIACTISQRSAYV